jgi:hypothetical protein
VREYGCCVIVSMCECEHAKGVERVCEWVIEWECGRDSSTKNLMRVCDFKSLRVCEFESSTERKTSNAIVSYSTTWGECTTPNVLT